MPSDSAAKRQELGPPAPFDRPLRVFNALQRQADVAAQHPQGQHALSVAVQEGRFTIEITLWDEIKELIRR